MLGIFRMFPFLFLFLPSGITRNVCCLFPRCPSPTDFAYPHLLTDSSRRLCFSLGEKEEEGCGLGVGG